MSSRGRLVDEALSSDEALSRSEDNDRMDVIGQNGNDGEHYVSEVGKFVGSLTTSQKTYELNSNNIYGVGDIVDILKAMDLTITIHAGDVREDCQKLIDNGIFKERKL